MKGFFKLAKNEYIRARKKYPKFHFMGVGSEVCMALKKNRKGIGVELKPSYYRQAVKNIHDVIAGIGDEQEEMLFKAKISPLIEEQGA